MPTPRPRSAKVSDSANGLNQSRPAHSLSLFGSVSPKLSLLPPSLLPLSQAS